MGSIPLSLLIYLDKLPPFLIYRTMIMIDQLQVLHFRSSGATNMQLWGCHQNLDWEVGSGYYDNCYEF